MFLFGFKALHEGYDEHTHDVRESHVMPINKHSSRAMVKKQNNVLLQKFKNKNFYLQINL